jgi:hypothetical protein
MKSMRQETTRPTTPDLDVTVDSYLAARTEADPQRCAVLVERAWSADGRLIDPPFAAAGRSNISRLASILQVEFPGYVYRRVGEVERDHGRLCFKWQFVAPNGTAAMEGIDVGELAADGRLRRVTRHHHARGMHSPCSRSDSILGSHPMERTA